MKTSRTLRTPLLSIVVPIYNEEKRLFNLFTIFDYLKHKKFSSEVILVNDGSKDNSLKLVRKIIEQLDRQNIIRLISYPTNKGKGFAIKKGMSKATGNYRLFCDIDLSTPIEQFNNFLPYLKKYDILIGSRKKKDSKLLLHQPRIREQLGKGFTKLSQVSLGLDFSDFTCGFKCFSKNAAQEIFSRQKINRWTFDSEILFIAKKLGLTVKEIPVIWKNDSETKVKLPDDIVKSLFELVKIRYNNFRKLYT